ncbi:MAG: hypothetical protein U5N53_12490, partial [Mycobacterium sp.]|nr:hypothetical protein [Mycobacterium sp.]
SYVLLKTPAASTAMIAANAKTWLPRRPRLAVLSFPITRIPLYCSAVVMVVFAVATTPSAARVQAS